MGTKVRVLAVLPIGGITYQPNQVVEFEAPVAKTLAESGQVDPHKEAVAYAIKELGAEVVVHAAPPAESTEEQQAEVIQPDPPQE